MYSPPASELKVPEGVVVDLDYTGEDNDKSKERDLNGSFSDKSNKKSKKDKKDKKDKKHGSNSSSSSSTKDDKELDALVDDIEKEEKQAEDENNEDSTPADQPTVIDEPIVDVHSMKAADLAEDCPAAKDNTCTALETDVVDIDNL